MRYDHLRYFGSTNLVKPELITRFPKSATERAVFVAYPFFGDHLPPETEAERFEQYEGFAFGESGLCCRFISAPDRFASHTFLISCAAFQVSTS